MEDKKHFFIITDVVTIVLSIHLHPPLPQRRRVTTPLESRSIWSGGLVGTRVAHLDNAGFAFDLDSDEPQVLIFCSHMQHFAPLLAWETTHSQELKT